MLLSVFWTNKRLVLLLGSFLAIIAGAQDSNSTSTANNCNICGDNNSIQFPTGVVEFKFQSETFRNNCQTWQQIVKSSSEISGEFCRYVLFNHIAAEVCGCTTPEGFFVADIIKQQQQQITTVPMPTPGSARLPDVITPTPAPSTTATLLSDIASATQEELQATPFTVTYAGITDDPESQDLEEAQDTTCKHVRDTVSELLGRIVSMACNATFYGRDMAVYDFGATPASSLNTANYTQEELNEAIDQAFSDQFRENKLLSELKALPDDNPFSSTTAITASTNTPSSSTVLTEKDETPSQASGSDSYGMVSGGLWGSIFLFMFGFRQLPY